MSRAVIVLVLTAALAGCGEEDYGFTDALSAARWSTPACAMVEGEPVATFSFDGGTTHAPFARPVADINIDRRSEDTDHLVALPDTADTLLAIRRTRIYFSWLTTYELIISRDAGCSWMDTGLRVGSTVTQLVAGVGGQAYVLEDGWSGPSIIRRVAADGTMTNFDAGELGTHVAAVIPHPQRARWLRTVSDWAIYETHELGVGARQPRLLPPAPFGRSVGSVDSAPDDWDRIAVIADEYDADRLHHPALHITHDGGRSWITPQGLETLGQFNDLFRVRFGSPSGDAVWLHIREFFRSDPPQSEWSSQDWLLRSTDGGRSFERVFQFERGTSGWDLFPHPSDPTKVSWSDGYRVYEFSAIDGGVVVRPDPARADIPYRGYSARRVVYSPADPRVIYLATDSTDVNF